MCVCVCVLSDRECGERGKNERRKEKISSGVFGIQKSYILHTTHNYTHTDIFIHAHIYGSMVPFLHP